MRMRYDRAFTGAWSARGVFGPFSRRSSRMSLLERIFMLSAIVGMLASGACESGKKAYPKAMVETEKGSFTITLYPDKAPNTVKNFIDLTDSGFYDGLAINRVVKGKVIQGGGPLPDGSGGPGYIIAAEFSDLKNVEGAVGMAHAGDRNSGGSQFYICLTRLPDLDGEYTVFGKVTEGTDVLHEIAEVPVDAENHPVEPIHTLDVEIRLPE